MKTLPLSKLTTDFLLRFFADPKKKFCKGVYARGRARCAGGFINEAFGGNPEYHQIPIVRRNAISVRGVRAFGVHCARNVGEINNGLDPRYPQRTIRARILAALRAKKAAK